MGDQWLEARWADVAPDARIRRDTGETGYVLSISIDPTEICTDHRCRRGGGYHHVVECRITRRVDFAPDGGRTKTLSVIGSNPVWVAVDPEAFPVAS